jgi:hypothetical protein
MKEITTINNNVRAKSQSDPAPETGKPALGKIEDQEIHPQSGKDKLDKEYQIHADYR